jgi:tetratricopeptide (TPR) repeat protein
MLQKRKTKYSEQLTERQFANVQILSRKWTGDKLDYYSFAAKTIGILEKYEDYHKISQICELLVKLQSEYEEASSSLMYDVLIYGFIANYHLTEYEQAFYYIRCLCKKYSKDNFCHTLLALCLQKIDPTIFRMYMSKVQIRVLEKECEAIKQILGNNYLQTGFFELSVNTYMKLQEADPDNPLIKLLLGVAYLQGFSSRTTINKPQMLLRAFECLESYKELRSKTHLCEAYYNMGR